MPVSRRRRRSMEIQIGADPEFEYFQGSHMVSAHTVDSQRRDMKAREGILEHTTLFDDKLGCDGHSSTGEIRPDPNGNPTRVAQDISNILDEAYEASQKCYDDSLGIYAGSGRIDPLGGHIHFSMIDPSIKLLQKFDQFISKPLNDASDRSVRSSFGNYGRYSDNCYDLYDAERSGCYRYQPHGWEYRTPCSWLSHPWIAKGTLRIAWLLANAQSENALYRIESWKELKEYARTKQNPTASVLDITRFKNILKRAKQQNIKLEQIEVLQAWRKKEPQDTSVTTFKTYIDLLNDSNDESCQQVVQEYRRMVSDRYNDDVGAMGVCGVSRNSVNVDYEAANSSAIFLPLSYRGFLEDKFPRLRNDHITVSGVRVEIFWWRDRYSRLGLSRRLRDTGISFAAAVLKELFEIEEEEQTNGCKEIIEKLERKIPRPNGRRKRKQWKGVPR